ncbi:hypothetical protein PsYK624_052460 [Phanerochaete sordida]|uniref:F-box domain-containing protein n=1 Tax=Phanerochaete sordida TaxID=48140 RepID=A0A9P3G4S8_9APHY|nr:hypothetical protein PsYK624_052460 [Phanerochaete sordida]
MHPALYITELLTAILPAADSWSPEKRRTAAAMASTCRAFYEPATNFLWEELPYVEPLLDCLAGAHGIDSPPSTDGASGLAVGKWACFFTHATRVKVLHVELKEYPSYSDEASKSVDDRKYEDIEEQLSTLVLIHTLSESPIFPKLHTVVVTDYFFAPRWSYASYVPFFMGPEVRRVKVEALGHATTQALSQLTLSCPQLRQLELDYVFDSDIKLLRCYQALEEALCSHHQCPVGLPMALAQLGSLRRASLRFPPEFAGLGKSGGQSILFPNLESLKLYDFPSISILPDFIQSIGSTRLTSLTVEDLGWVSNDTTPFDQTIAALAKFPMLRELILEGTDHTPLHVLDRSVFPPLPPPKLHLLEELTISLPDVFHVETQTIPELGKAWPSLRRLDVRTKYKTYGHEDPPRVWTLDALDLCAAHLPNLQYLDMDFDTSTIRSLPPPSSRSLSHITIYTAFTQVDEQDVALIAAYISSIYPNAHVLFEHIWWGGEDDPDVRRWIDIGRAVAKARGNDGPATSIEH